MPNNDMIARGQTAREQVNLEVVPALMAQFGQAVELIAPTVDQIPQLFATVEGFRPVAEWLKEHGFRMLVDIGGVDYYPNREPRFEVVYHFRQFPNLGMIRIRVRCSEKDQIPTLSDLWAMANPAEREVFDQFGLKFKGHPNMTRILNPDDWEGHPLRRDYPMRGPRALINLEMPAEINVYPPFVADEEADKSSPDGK